MTESRSAGRSFRLWVYTALVVVFGALTFVVMLLWQNITERKIEARHHVFRIADITEDTIDPSEWGKNYPRQYDSYRRTVDTERTRHGGSEAFQKLEEEPVWKLLFQGYPFGVDYREERGHAYMLSDQDMTERVKQFKQPGACLHCHSSVLPAYRNKGREAGVPNERPLEQIQKGFEVVCKMPYAEARSLVSHPVACLDCHHPDTSQLRVLRPAFLEGLKSLAKSDEPVPHLASIERWRKGPRTADYDPNKEASRQELRSLVCGQCHVEYYFKGEGKIVTYPWHKGLKAEHIEAYYNDVNHVDWRHAVTKAPLLKAQHPEFELWSQGIHARSGVACADCHMPYLREGAVKISDHHVKSPLINIARACQTCHRFEEKEILARAFTIQDRTRALLNRGEKAVSDLIGEISALPKEANPEKTKPVLELHRQAQWRLDYVAAENSMGFHAPQEAARILAEAIDLARQGQVEALKLKRP